MHGVNEHSVSVEVGGQTLTLSTTTPSIRTHLKVHTHTHTSYSNYCPPHTHSPSTSPSTHSIPTFQHPSHSLLKANGFKQQQYHKYRHNCLKGTRPHRV